MNYHKQEPQAQTLKIHSIFKTKQNHADNRLYWQRPARWEQEKQTCLCMEGASQRYAHLLTY